MAVVVDRQTLCPEQILYLCTIAWQAGRRTPRAKKLRGGRRFFRRLRSNPHSADMVVYLAPDFEDLS